MGGSGPGPQPARSLRWWGEAVLACGFSLTAWMCCSSPGDSGLVPCAVSCPLPAPAGSAKVKSQRCALSLAEPSRIQPESRCSS
jgi:hypothetical protein